MLLRNVVKFLLEFMASHPSSRKPHLQLCSAKTLISKLQPSHFYKQQIILGTVCSGLRWQEHKANHSLQSTIGIYTSAPG